jgi:uncharacterized protein YjbI with pentapeptide repeats
VLLVAVGLYLTNSFNRDQFQLQQDSTRQQQDLALTGQRADRFVKAIDQLGQEGTREPGQNIDDKLGIRLGGIYALETLMRDSPDDENTIIEVLCAFIRTHAPRPAIIPKWVRASSVDVRAALSVLGRRPFPSTHKDLDLSNTLLGLDLMDLRGANLIGADLNHADLTGTELTLAHLKFAGLAEANLKAADLTGADLTGAMLTRADLTGTQLLRVNLFSANLRGAALIGANLTLSGLAYADLTDANLSHAYLPRADLTGAHLTGADLTSDQLLCARITDTTKLPPGVKRPTPHALTNNPNCKH